MGIDLKSGGRRKGHNVRKAPVSQNVYVKLLEKLYRLVKYQIKIIIIIILFYSNRIECFFYNIINNI